MEYLANKDASMDDIVAACYEAAAGTRHWGDACALFCEAMDLWCVQILGIFRGTGSIAFSFEGGPVSAEAALQFVLHYHAINPRFSLDPLIRDGRWVHDHEHFDEAFVSQDPFFQEYLIPSGGRYASATKLVDDSELVVLLTLHRGVGKSPLDDVQVQAVDRIRGHLERAIRLHLKRSLDHPRSAAGHALLELLPYGVFVVDETRRIGYRNSTATEMLRRGGPLIERAGRLDCMHLRGSRQMLAMIHSLGLGGSLVDGSGADRTAIKLSGSTGGPALLIFAIAVRGNAALQAFGDQPCGILIVHPIETAAGGGLAISADPFIVSLAFGLTPAESRVAIALAGGAAPTEVAKQRGVGLPTIRAQVRVIFEKMGVRRQAEMASMILELPQLKANGADSRGLLN